MKLNISKKSSANFLTKIILIVSVITLAFIAPIESSQKVSADQFDDKINALQNNINQYQAESDRLNGQALTLQTALAQLANEKGALQAQIDLNQAKYDQLVIDIANTEKKIKDNQDALGQTIADLYVDEKISPLEMLASSKNISDYLDKQEYRNSVRDQLSSAIKEIKDLKAALDQQKADVEKILTEQKTERDSLAAKENAQQNLLNETQNNETSYQNLISSSVAQISEARALQAALNSRSTSTGGYKVFAGGLLPAYITDSSYGSWNNSNCPIVNTYMSSIGVSYSNPPYNGEDGRGYGCRQCASYVAWKINQVKGTWPSLGNAYDFRTYGASDGSPHAGDIAVLTSAGQPGHVAWVETDPYTSTSGPLKGKQVITVSQYNYDYGQGYGMYSLMELSVNFFNVYRTP
jgi:peptidoglycan hydrolase CwlO-like protein